MTPQEYKEGINTLLSDTEASQLYIQLATCDHDNLIKTKVTRWIRDDMRHKYHLRGGDFVEACWAGDVKKAYIHADFENLNAVEETRGVTKDEYLGWE